MSKKGVLVIGDSFVDVVAGPLEQIPSWGTDTKSPEPIISSPGGSAQNVAANLASFPVNTYFYTGLGNDSFGQIIRNHSLKTNYTIIEPQKDDNPNVSTGVCIVLSGYHDRGFVSYYGKNSFISCENLDISNLKSIISHIHVGGFFVCQSLKIHLPNFITKAKEFGLTISLDTNYDSSEKWNDETLINQIIPNLDIFLPNELEAQKLTKTNSVSDALTVLKSWIKGVVVIKVGKNGAIAFHDGEYYEMSCPQIEVVDTVGAGDAFNSAFISKYIEKCSIKECLYFGCLAGSYCVTKRGACENPPTQIELLQFAKQQNYSFIA